MSRRKPTRAELRVIRRRRYFEQRLFAAATPRDRLAAAVDYLQAVLAASEPDTAHDTAATAAAYLQRLAEAARTKELR